MRFSKGLFMAGLAGFSLLSSSPARAGLKVMASLPVFADAARAIGRDRVEVWAVGKELQDPHFIQPTPWAITRLSRADVYLTTGLDLELWSGPLLEASANHRVFMNSPGYVDLSVGIPLLQIPMGNVTRLAGDVHMMGNPHYYYSPVGMLHVSRTIEERFVDLDPAGAEQYRTGGEAYRRELEAAAARWKTMLAPFAGAPVVPFHNAFPYFEDWSGLRILDHIEPKPGINPSANHLARLTLRMRKENVKVILHEPYYNRSFSESLAARTSAKVILFYSQPGPKGGGETYVEMMDHNIQAIVAALDSP